MITSVLVVSMLLGLGLLACAVFGPDRTEAKGAAVVASGSTVLVMGAVFALFKLWGG
jgi:hypothetical protein